jgi:fluoride exporter
VPRHLPLYSWPPGRWRRISTASQRRLAVVSGGTLGTLGRSAVSDGTTTPGTWPWATFAVNLIGTLILGWLLARLLRSGRPMRLIIPFLGIGVLGGFTTFGAFAYETWELTVAGRWPMAALYVLASVALGLGVAVAGSRLAEVR